MKPQHVLLAILVNAVWGSLFVVSTLGLYQFPPIFFTGLRFALLAVVLAPLLRPVPGQMRRLAVVALVMGIGMYVTLYLALAWAENTGAVAVFDQLAVPFAVVLGIVCLGEAVSGRRIVGTAVALMGAFVIGFDPAALDDLDALAIITVSAFLYAVAMVLVRGLATVGAFTINAWMAAMSALPLLAVSAVFETGQLASVKNADIWGWAALAYAALVGSLVGHGGMYYLLRFYPVGLLAPFTLLTPVFAVAGGVLFLEDQLTVPLLVGSALILAGVLVVTMGKARREPEQGDTR